jgi:hypothetical protein
MASYVATTIIGGTSFQMNGSIGLIGLYHTSNLSQWGDTNRRALARAGWTGGARGGEGEIAGWRILLVAKRLQVIWPSALPRKGHSRPCLSTQQRKNHGMGGAIKRKIGYIRAI